MAGPRLGIDTQRGSTPVSVVVATGVALVALVTLLDYETPSEIRFYAFYFVPVSFVSWYTGRRWGLALSVLATAAWTAPNHFLVGRVDWNILGINFVMMLASFVTVSLLISGRRAQFERESELARSDALTGLANRRAFEDMLRLEIARARRYVHPLALVYLDLDGFKRVNDELGHRVGDELLRDVATTVRTAVRTTDIVARLGGDEFAVMLPETAADAAGDVVERIRTGVAARMQARGWPVTVSAGVLACDDAPPDIEVLVARADALMYEAKRGGKNSARYERVSSVSLEPPMRDATPATDDKPN